MTTLFRLVTFSFLFLTAAGLAADDAFAACVSGPTTLCLNEQRFKLDVQWKDFQGGTGVGQAVPLTSDTGYFWFFNSANVELMVKVLDARVINGKFWVFFGALSNVEYSLRVTDTVTGSVKTYFNPSGQFASVGDTSAFSDDGTVSSAFVFVEANESSLLARPLPTHSSVAAEAQSTCVALETNLCLNGGRFRVEVNWKDFQGGTGVGKAVSLTPDTGYFWFFNSANVELVVKVLDARILNQRFWVFYGALSNVEYEMTVTDTLTGNVSSYVNPSGRFASTGDTGAFPAGHAVTVRLDESRAVTADLATEGGTITATASNGTVFTLTIPKDALLSDERITMTPVAAIDGLPLSGGLAAAVDLKPTGLRLFDFATLKITPAQPIPLAEEITFAWRGSGEEFFLYPPELGLSDVSMKLMHFSGYGVGRGSAADEAAQQQRVPASREDALSQKLQALLASRRRAQSPIRGASEQDPVWALVLEYYNYLRYDLEFAKRSCPAANVILPWVESWMREAGRAGCCREEISAALGGYVAAVVNCYNESFDKCVSQKDPRQVKEILRHLKKLEILNAASRVDRSKVERCVRFELHFESTAEFPFSTPAFSHQVRAVVPLRLSSDIFAPVTGSAPFRTVNATFFLAACPYTTKADDAVFDVTKLRINFNQFEGAGTPPDPVTLAYRPGKMTLTFQQTCSGGPVPPMQFPGGWWFPHQFNHVNEVVGDGEYENRGWQLIGGGEVYARKNYDLSEPHREKTTIELKHKPDASP